MKILGVTSIAVVCVGVVGLLLEPIATSILSINLPIDNVLYWILAIGWVTYLFTLGRADISLKIGIAIYVTGVVLSMIGLQLAETVFRISFILLSTGVVGLLLSYKKFAK